MSLHALHDGGSAVCEKDDIYEFITHKYEHYVGTSAEASFFSRENQAEVLCKFLDVIMEGDYKMKKFMKNSEIRNIWKKY